MNISDGRGGKKRFEEVIRRQILDSEEANKNYVGPNMELKTEINLEHLSSMYSSLTIH